MPWWYLIYPFAKGWRGVEWWTFWAIFLGLFTFIVVRLLYPGLGMTGVPRILRNAAPIEQMDAFMNETYQGYLVQRTQTLERDPQMRNQLLITYEVKTLDESRTWTFTWGWNVPFDALFRPTREQLTGMIPYCRLIPKTDAATEIQDSLTGYLTQRGVYFDLNMVFSHGY